MKQNMSKILVVRNDKLGDFMLALPAYCLLKTALPDSVIHALVPQYTLDMATASSCIDDVIIDPGAGAGIKQQLMLLKEIRKQRYDAVITLFSTGRTGFTLWLSRIPLRLAPATKLAQVFYNYRLKQKRSRSEKPEYEYNQDLIRHYLELINKSTSITTSPPYLSFPQKEVQQLRDIFCSRYSINPDHTLFFIHPGSGGSAVNLSIQQYATLANEVLTCGDTINTDTTVVISAGPGEEQYAQQLASLLPKTMHHVVYQSTQGLLNFAKHIAFADVFISGSTGPLHIAGALDRPTAAFYPRRRSATSLRWQTLNSENKRLAFSPGTDAKNEDMQSIDIKKVALEIKKSLLN